MNFQRFLNHLDLAQFNSLKYLNNYEDQFSLKYFKINFQISNSFQDIQFKSNLYIILNKN
jgi:hypothetical protein